MTAARQRAEPPPQWDDVAAAEPFVAREPAAALAELASVDLPADSNAAPGLIDPAAIESATIDSATIDSATMDSAVGDASAADPAAVDAASPLAERVEQLAATSDGRRRSASTYCVVFGF